MSLGTSLAGMCVFENLHPSFQQYPLVWKRGHMMVPSNLTLLSMHFPWNVFSHDSPSFILNSGTWSLFTSLMSCLQPPLSSLPSPLRFPPDLFLGSFSLSDAGSGGVFLWKLDGRVILKGCRRIDMWSLSKLMNCSLTFSRSSHLRHLLRKRFTCLSIAQRILAVNYLSPAIRFL